MSETTAAAPQKSDTKKAKKATKGSTPKKSKTPSNHPKYLDMAISAITALKERNGSSRQALHKYYIFFLCFYFYCKNFFVCFCFNFYS
jgi:histone H1/5